MISALRLSMIYAGPNRWIRDMDDYRAIDDFWSRMPVCLDAVVRTAGEMGLVSHMVGGGVRDLILGRAPVDFDVVVDSGARELAAQTARRFKLRVVVVNQRFSTQRIAARGQAPVDLLDVDGDLDRDLRRRDFTANAMALELTPNRGQEPIDPLGGTADIERKLVRAVGQKSVTDQPIRALRAFKLLMLLGPGSTICEDTLGRIGEACTRIADEPGETVGRELAAVLNPDDIGRRVRLMADSGVLYGVLPEADADLDVVLSELAGLEEIMGGPDLPEDYADYMKSNGWLAVLCLLLGRDAEHGRVALKRLRRSRAEAGRLKGIALSAFAIAHSSASGLRSAAREYGEDSLAGALAAAAGLPDHGSRMDLLTSFHREFPAGLKVRHEPLLCGEDLLNLGISPGPLMGSLLRRLDEERLENPGLSRDRALELVREWIEDSG